MRQKDPELMKKIRTYIGEFYIEHDRTPSTTEIAKYFGIARSTSQNYLVAMNERGLLSYQGGRDRKQDYHILLSDPISTALSLPLPRWILLDHDCFVR